MDFQEAAVYGFRIGQDAVALRADRRAVTALEYGIMAAFFSLTLLGVFTRFGTSLTSLFSGIATSL